MFGKFGVLCFLETPVLRFALLHHYRRISLATPSNQIHAINKSLSKTHSSMSAIKNLNDGRYDQFKVELFQELKKHFRNSQNHIRNSGVNEYISILKDQIESLDSDVYSKEKKT